MTWWQILLIILVTGEVIADIVKQWKQSKNPYREEIVDACWKLVKDGKISYTEFYQMSLKDMVIRLDKEERLIK